MKKIYAFAILLLLIASVFSCKKDKDDTKPNTNSNHNTLAGRCFVTKITDDAEEQSFTTFTYNSLMQAERMNFFFEGELEVNYRFGRDNLGRISTMDGFEENEKFLNVLFKYNPDNSLSSARIFSVQNGAAQEDGSIVFEYNTARQITKIKNVIEPGGQLEVSTNLTWDDRGNIIKEEQFFMSDEGELEPDGIVEFEYDDKKNPLLETGLPIYLNQASDLSKNNVTKITNKDGNGEVRYIFSYTYEYNAEGYPKKQTGTSESSSTFISLSDYTCK